MQDVGNTLRIGLENAGGSTTQPYEFHYGDIVIPGTLAVTEAAGVFTYSDSFLLPHGGYLIRLYIQGQGYAQFTHNGQIQDYYPGAITGKISSVTPALGSKYGGTEITIDGYGFRGEGKADFRNISIIKNTKSWTGISVLKPALQ